MIFIDKMKNLKIYKSPLFLPTMDDDKKKKSAILLMTPNYDSSKKILNNQLFINKLRYESYYIERDISYYINSKIIEEASNAEFSNYNYLEEKHISAAERNALKDSDFGLPKVRKYPLDCKERVEHAIKFFNYCNKQDEVELAKNIIKAAKKFNMKINCGKNNRFSKYFKDYLEKYPEDIENLQEAFWKTEPDMFYNKDKFDCGKLNLCFIIGNMGSGKTTMGKDLAKTSENIIYIQMDLPIQNDDTIDLSKPDKYDDIIVSFFKGPGSEYFHLTYDEKVNKFGNIGNFEKQLSRSFINYAIKYAASHKNKKFVLDGVYMFWYMKPEELENYAVFIKGTSLATSSFRRIKRDMSHFKRFGDKLSILGGHIKELQYTIEDEKDIQKFRDYYKNKKFTKIISYPMPVLEEYNDCADIQSSTLLKEFSNILNTGDKLIFFNEDAKNDAKLKKLLYNDRIKQRKEVLLLYDNVKKDLPYIKYTYPELKQYIKRNVFVDLYFYNKVFFENNDWVLNKGLLLYLDFIDKLINNPNLKNNGYEKKTVFIPINDWNNTNNYSLWNYRLSINPLSAMYQLMYTEDIRLKKIFGNTNIIFVGNNNYFKINFSELDQKNMKIYANKFRLFLIKICKNEEFDLEDVDTAADTITPKAIRTNIIDKIDMNRGVDLTPELDKIDKEKEKTRNLKIGSTNIDSILKSNNKDEKNDKIISKLTLNKNDTDNDKSKNIATKLAYDIDTITAFAKSEEEALNDLDNLDTKKLLIGLGSGNDDKVDISAGRAARMTELDKKLLDSKLNGITIKELLDAKPVEIDNISLDVSSPNEEWKNLSFINFDKGYNLEADIINCFRHFQNVSRPISIRNIEVENTSTSEDRIALYKVDMEDYRAKRFKIKLEIPIMVDNRFLLRGNNKSIQTQFFNMPIIKTDFGTCQIVTNYHKIFIYRFGSGNGKSLPMVSRFIRALKKYKGKGIKFTTGYNHKISRKYQLPIDYIDLADEFSTIETSNHIIYFNQDDIRSLYDVEDDKGLAFAYDKKDRKLIYYSDSLSVPFINYMIGIINYGNDNQEFMDILDKVTRPSVSSYSRCSIMNSKIPMIIICAYHEGLRKTLEKANIKYDIRSTLSKETRKDIYSDWIKFKDGYLIYESTYESSLLLNGLKQSPTEDFEIADIDNKNMYLEFLDSYGGRIKADGLENFYDCLVDPITKPILDYYGFPTDYVSILLYANSLMADNKFIKHSNTSSRRFRKYELIAVYTYQVLAEAYGSYANQLKHNRDATEFIVKPSAVIDKFLTDSISSDDSCINALHDIETTNSVTTKGPSGMNTDRAYSLDKRTYDDSMLNVLGMSTGFAANVGITRQATIDANVEGNRGFVKNIKGDTSKMNTASTLTATEAMLPFGSTRDDPMRTAMSFIQTSKHMVRTEESDPLLVTNGFDEVMPFMTSNRFAFKAKKSGRIAELTENYIMLIYEDGTKDFINLTETIEKNSDGGYYVPLKLTLADNLKLGSKIKENQIIAYDKYSFSNSVGESDNLAYNIGKLAKVAIINTDEGFEDSGVITESMANKLATRIDLKYDVVLDKDVNIFEIAKVGDHIECGDPLLIWQDPFEDEDATELLKTLVGDDISELGKRKLKSEVTGKVSGIKIFRTIQTEEMSDSLKKIVTDYEKPLIELEEKLKKENLDTSFIPAHYVLDPIGKLKRARDAVLIEFYVEYLDVVGTGDKVVYYSANKAVEKNVIPLGKEPYTEFRPNEKIDAFVSEVSIDKRMVCSTAVYGSLQKLMIELDRSIKDIMNIPYDDTTV